LCFLNRTKKKGVSNVTEKMEYLQCNTGTEHLDGCAQKLQAKDRNRHLARFFDNGLLFSGV
jgi:hypothetical protein